jgi:hypothetical protein
MFKHLNSDRPLNTPQSGQIYVYKDALERLNTSIAFNASDLDLVKAVRLYFVISSASVNAHLSNLGPSG